MEKAETRCPANLRSCLDGFAPPLAYGGPISALISELKFKKVEHISSALAALADQPMVRPDFLEAATHIIPIPLATKRLQQRGFNQSALIARQLAKRWSLKVSHCLRKERETQPQTSMSAAERHLNVQGAFRARSRPPRHIILLDDVVTTGATMREAAITLRQAGAESIFGLAIALTPGPHLV